MCAEELQGALREGSLASQAWCGVCLAKVVGMCVGHSGMYRVMALQFPLPFFVNKYSMHVPNWETLQYGTKSLPHEDDYSLRRKLF